MNSSTKSHASLIASFILAFFLTLSGSLYAQLKDGIYKTNKNSDKLNYYLKVNGPEGIMYGRDINAYTDTIFFKAPFKVIKDAQGVYNFKLKKMKYSLTSVNHKNLGDFSEEKDFNKEEFIPYKTYEGLLVEGVLRLQASRVRIEEETETFHFVKVAD